MKTMQELMLGYLLEALDDDERQYVEQKLQEDPSLVQQLEQLRDSLHPLEADNVDYAAPQDLTDQTCRVVAACSAVTPSIHESNDTGGLSSWRVSDIVVGAGLIAAAAFFFFPALMQSKVVSQREDCANNLRELGVSLAEYSNNNGGYFPKINRSGKQSAAGIYAVRLKQQGFLPSTHILICSASSIAEQRETLTIPTVAQLEASSASKLRQHQMTMGGSYAYTIGYFTAAGRYQPTKNRNRENFVIMADVLNPSDGGKVSGNHGGCGQNVLLESGRVRFVSTCHMADCFDDFFRNDQGQIAAGMHHDDAVVAHSAATPVLYQPKNAPLASPTQ